MVRSVSFALIAGNRSIPLLLPLMMLLVALQAVTPATAQATVKILSTSTYFHTPPAPDPSGMFDIIAGRTLSSTACTDNTTTCDSCKAQTAPFANGAISCSSNDLTKDTIFQITLTSDQASAYIYPICFNGLIGIRASASTGTGVVTAVSFANTSYTSTGSGGTMGVANTPITASFRWGDICSTARNNDGECTTSFDQQLQVGFLQACNTPSANISDSATFRLQFRYVGFAAPMTFSPDPATSCGVTKTNNQFEGICYYEVYPGDQKMYLTNMAGQDQTVGANSGFPNNMIVGDMEATASPAAQDPSHIFYSFLRAYYVPGDFNALATATGQTNSVDLNFDGRPFNDALKITGADITNGQQYSVLLANGDQAGIITHFAAGPGITWGTLQTAIPEPVHGFLDNKKCFVATAAYGSEMAPQVERLRTFRDRYLLHSTPGKSFVRFYYNNSPAWARVIAGSELLRLMARLLLLPSVGLVDLVLAAEIDSQWSGLVSALFLVSLAASLVGLVCVIWRIIIWRMIRKLGAFLSQNSA
ncbi:MAG: hypothetical protein C5B49_15580 [Bdellovibrio sp.]|nr:MAG: hypothetical protein C5B49_15580 [Bdellovibrio sp.]